ncbi:N/A [soil metagenome]
MDRTAQLDAIVAEYDLNKHPFYQDWRMGTLPTAKLADYAGEYGRFVATIAQGWETTGHPHYAEEEREHELFWADFMRELKVDHLSNRPETEALVSAAHRLFATKPEAIGALYSFEAQQPHTSRSKLDGLNEHYALSDKAKHYFVVHADDVAEAEELRTRAAELSDTEFEATQSACRELCQAMWKALDGVYQA